MARKRRLLLLGGTAEALRLARELDGHGRVECISSLAGRTGNPVMPPGRVRVGGFGGVPGLTTFLINESIDLVLDATHPFAAQMANNAYEACAEASIPRAKLVRPPWVPSPGDRWTMMPSVTAAATFLRFHPAQRIFLALGRQEIGAFVPLGQAVQDGAGNDGGRNGGAKWFLTRMIDPPGEGGVTVPPGEVVLGRGPFAPEAEKDLMQRHGIELLVTKNSGGAAGKIAAAAELHLPVLMIERPPLPPGEVLDSVGAALAWININAV